MRHIQKIVIGFFTGFTLCLLSVTFEDFLHTIPLKEIFTETHHYYAPLIIGIVGAFIANYISNKQKRLKQALQSSKINERKFKTLFNTMTDVVCILDKDYNIIDVNESATKLYEYSKEELLHMNVSDLIYENDSEHSSSHFNKLETDGFYEMYEGRIKTKSGKIKWIQVNSTAIVQHDIKTGSQDIIRDITEKKNLEISLHTSKEELARLNRNKDKFISIIAHDLTNPFNSLIGLSDYLIKYLNQGTKDKSDRIARQINATAKNTYYLLKNLLDWAMSQGGDLPFNPEKINIKEYLQSPIKSLENEANLKSISLTYQFDENLTVKADKNMLLTIVRNLLTNAIKFTDCGGSVDITAYEKDNLILFCFKDTGIGMDEQTIKNIFNSQIKNSTPGTTGEKGTGLGLSLCQEFVKIHKGKIWVESEPGKGTCFIFSIPRNQE